MKQRGAPALRLVEGQHSGGEAPSPEALAFARALARRDAAAMLARLNNDSMPRKA